MKNKDNPDVPVFIDSVKDSEDFKNTRCIYYRIEFDDRLFKVRQSFISNNFEVMGTWAILTSPFEEITSESFFVSYDIIKKTLKYIEDNDHLFLEIGNIWIPNFLIFKEDNKQKVRQGDVYRISKELFSLCYGYVAGFIKEEDWIENSGKYLNDIKPSAKETEAFKEWRNKRIEESTRRYHRKPKKEQLQKKKSKK